MKQTIIFIIGLLLIICAFVLPIILRMNNLLDTYNVIFVFAFCLLLLFSGYSLINHVTKI